MDSADNEAGQGDIFDERAPSPHLTPVRSQQFRVTEDCLPQNDELESQQANGLKLQQDDDLDIHQQASADPLADCEDREQVHVPSDEEDALGSVIVDDEGRVVLSQEADPEESVVQEAEEIEEEATEAGQDLEYGSDLALAEADDFVVMDVVDSAEASMRQGEEEEEEEEDGPSVADEETHPQDSGSREEELATDDQELRPQEPTGPEETTEATSEVPTSEEDEPSPLTEALKDITNVPNHKEEDLQDAEAQYEADAPEDESVASVSEETVPEETGHLELPAVQEVVILDSEEHSADAPSLAAAVAVDELYVPTSHLYIPDVMDQTLAFDRLEEEVGEVLAKEEGEEPVLLAPQKAQQVQSLEPSLTPPEGNRAPEEGEEDSSVTDVGDSTSGQGASADELPGVLATEISAASGASGEQDIGTSSTASDLFDEPREPRESSASLDQDDATLGANNQLLTTEDETLAFEVAEGLPTGAAPSVEDSMREAIELSLSEDPARLEQVPVGIEEASNAGDIRQEAVQRLADQEQPQGQSSLSLTEGSSSPITLVSVPASPAPATPTPAAPDTSSASFMMDSPGVGLSFRRRYDENVLASAAKRAQQSFALGARYAQSPANDSLKSLKASPMPLSLAGTPLGERNANISLSRREIELSPTLKQAAKLDHNLPPLTPRLLDSPPQTTEDADHLVSPHMRRMMDVRDAMLMASPTKSPRKPPMRVTVPSPHKAEPMSSTTAPLGSPVRKTGPSPVTQMLEPDKVEDKSTESGVSTASASDVAHLFKKPEMTKPNKDVATQLPSVSSKAPSSAAPASRLPKLASGNSRIAKPTSVGSIRAPTAIPSARSQSAQSSSATSSQLARPSVPSQTTGQSHSGNPFQKKAAPKAAAPASSLSRPPSAADSIGSSNSSLNGASKEKTLKDPRVPPVSSAPQASAGSSNGPSPVKRTQPISALRKMQGTSQLSSFTHKTADWLKGSTADLGAQWSLGKSALPSPALPRPTGPPTAVSEVENEVMATAPPSPVKAAMTAGSGRARRVLAGSKEATHAPSEAKAAPIVRPRVLMSSTSSARTDSDLEGGARSDAALSSSPDKTARTHSDSIPPVMERPMMATYRKPPSSSSHGAKSLRVASGSSRKASRTGESAPSSSSVGPSPLSEAPIDETPSPALDATAPKEDAVVKDKDIGHRSLSNPLAAASARTGATARSASNPAAAVVTAPPARASRAKVNDVVPSVPISSAALATLTTRNSRRNEIHLVKLSVVTIRIEGARPPSPSSKIRKSSLAEGASPMEKGRADEARAVRARKRARESQESRTSAGSEAGERDAERGGVGVWRDPDFRGWETEMAQHRLGAGEEETYSTPLRVKKRTAGKGVRWRKNLFAAPASSSSTSASASTPWKSNLVAKDYQLDRHGNARSGDAPPSPSWKRVRVTVRKIVYDDDEEEGDGGGESASSMVDGWGGLEREGAASDSEYGGQV
jgi:hypothetical protein